jgi:two-component system chemotaxis response regulator CheY
MITAAHDPETVRKAELYGADGFLTKPVHLHELLALVGRTRLFPGGARTPPRPEPGSAPRAVAAPSSAPALAASASPSSPWLSSAPSSSPSLSAATPPAGFGDPELHPPAGKGQTSPGRRVPRVLVVDDDQDILDWCRTVFSRAGAVVDAIQDPSALRDTLPPGGTYDLVLLDIFMPAIDGIELLRRFSSDVRNLASRFYIITAEEDPALRQLARQSGADGYLTKPLQPEALLSLLTVA